MGIIEFGQLFLRRGIYNRKITLQKFHFLGKSASYDFIVFI